jgi:hypothetical protein
VALVSASAAPQQGGFYEQHRRSHQHAFDVDGLIYFRRLDSVVRPYLGTSIEVLRFTSNAIVSASSTGPALPGPIASTRLALRSAVGIDVAMSRSVSFRYSFSETIGGNPISRSLTPPGERGLANFQNLFGIVGRFERCYPLWNSEYGHPGQKIGACSIFSPAIRAWQTRHGFIDRMPPAGGSIATACSNTHNLPPPAFVSTRSSSGPPAASRLTTAE